MSGNHVIIEAWNTVLFEKFCRFRHLLVNGLSGHSDEALKRHSFPKGAHVLDIGCGFGDTTLQIARAVGPGGSASGVDCALNFVEAATHDAAKQSGVSARFFLADVQVDALGGPYHDAFSRFGTMFFELPVLAMRNIRRSLVPGGKLTMIVWRKREDNPWLHEAEKRVQQIVPVVTPEPSQLVHCGPGPFSMASADMVSDLLIAAGYDRITFERFDTDICIGRNLEDALEFAMALGPAGEIIRLAGEEGEKRRPAVAEALRDTLRQFERDGEVWAPSSTWFVSAYNPG